MKITIISLLVLLTSFTLRAEVLTLRQQEIKKEIIQIASLNTNNIMNRAQIRTQIESLVFELTKDLEVTSLDTWKKYATGSWKQLWADEDNNGPSEIAQNLDRIYQYVNAKGMAVNLGERILPNGDRVTFALSAKGSVIGNIQETTILAGFFKPTPLLKGMDIGALANDILSQNFQIFTPTQLGEFPNGPVNATSDLTFLYLDQDLKIGTAPNVYSGASEMFLLVRENIIK